MPFEIVRNDITNMHVDAIVNTANPEPIIGYGVDAGIHQKAGPKLLDARQAIGRIAVGEVAITPGFDLDARYVIHAVGPVWQDGKHSEAIYLRRCYENALLTALNNNCSSVAFPLISAGNHGFPKSLSLQIAINVFSSFLMEHDMYIYLVVFGKSAFELSEKLFHSVESFIDENYILNKTLDEYGVTNKRDIKKAELEQLNRAVKLRKQLRAKAERTDLNILSSAGKADSILSDTLFSPGDLDELLSETDAGFSETLLKLIDRSGKKDSEIYKKANVDRKLFSKIRNNPDYRPSKVTAIAFALALELDLEETQSFIGRAGYTLSHSSKFDIIVEFFILNKNYNVFEIDAVLFHYDQPLIGAE